MEFENITIETPRPQIALLTINRPKKLNALNKQTIHELSVALDYLESDASTRVLIITGAGDRAFVAGADISEFANFSKAEGKELAAEGQRNLFDKIENFSKPIIAAINGYALGGGLELAMAAHVRYASENAKMGLPEVTLGLIPGYGGTQRLPQIIGKGRAAEMILSAQMIDANRALEYGLVTSVTTFVGLLEHCFELATKMLQNAPNALTTAIQAINARYATNVNGFEKEIELFGNCFGTSDFIEGTQAFLNKKKPNF